MSAFMRPVVLVVDDDLGIRESLRFLFEEAGYEVEEAGDGGEALAIIRGDARARIVLLDRMMARMDGARMLREFANEPEAVRRRAVLLFMTARNDPPEPEIVDLIQRETFAAVAKPFDLDALLALVERAGAYQARHAMAESSTPRRKPGACS